MAGVCDVPVISSVCNAAGEAAGSLVSAPFDWAAQGAANVAAWMFESVWEVFDTTTRVDITSSAYTRVYNILFGLAVFIVAIFFCLQLIGGLIRRDPNALKQAALGSATSIVGSFLVITITGLLLEITDQASEGMIHATGTTMTEMGAKIGALAAGIGAITLAQPGAGAILMLFLAGMAICAAAILWFSLLIRKALLLVAIVLAPIAFAGATWQTTKGWISKWASFVIALIVSKLVITVIFLVAAAQVSAPISADLASISEPIAGIVLLFIAGFAPYMVYKFIAFAGFDTYHSMSSEQEAKSAMNRPIPIGRPSARPPAKVLDGSGTGGGSTGGVGGSPPAVPAPAAAPASTSASPAAAAGVGAAVVGPAAAAVGSVVAGAKTGKAIGNAAATEAAAHDPDSSAGPGAGGVQHPPATRLSPPPPAAPPSPPSSGPPSPPGAGSPPRPKGKS